MEFYRAIEKANYWYINMDTSETHMVKGAGPKENTLYDSSDTQFKYWQH